MPITKPGQEYRLVFDLPLTDDQKVAIEKELSKAALAVIADFDFKGDLKHTDLRDELGIEGPGLMGMYIRDLGI